MPEHVKGFLAMLLAACIWCLAGIFYKALDHVPPLEVLSHRGLWSLVFLVPLLAGQRRLRQHGIDPADPGTWLFIEDGKAYTSFNGIIRAGRIAGRARLLLQPLTLLPRPVQDWLYLRLARNRYRLFGRQEMCALPDEDLRKRIIE